MSEVSIPHVPQPTFPILILHYFQAGCIYNSSPSSDVQFPLCPHSNTTLQELAGVCSPRLRVALGELWSCLSLQCLLQNVWVRKAGEGDTEGAEGRPQSVHWWLSVLEFPLGALKQGPDLMKGKNDTHRAKKLA